MTLLIDVISWFFISMGACFSIIGGIGTLRFPDFYTRMHAAGIVDTLGAGSILVGLAFQAGFSLITFKILVIWGFLWLTSPTAANALASAAMARGLEPLLKPKGGATSSPK